MKNITLCFLMVLMASCQWIIPDKDPMKELLLAQKTMEYSVDVLQKLKDDKKLAGKDLVRAQKLVKVAHGGILAWKDSVKQDEEAGLPISPRPDLSRIVFDALEKLKEYTGEEDDRS